MSLMHFPDSALVFLKDNFSLIVAFVLLFVLGPVVFSGLKKIIKVFLVLFLVVAIGLIGYLLYYGEISPDLINKLNLNSIITWFNDVSGKIVSVVK